MFREIFSKTVRNFSDNFCDSFSLYNVNLLAYCRRHSLQILIQIIGCVYSKRYEFYFVSSSFSHAINLLTICYCGVTNHQKSKCDFNYLYTFLWRVLSWYSLENYLFFYINICWLLLTLYSILTYILFITCV